MSHKQKTAAAAKSASNTADTGAETLPVIEPKAEPAAAAATDPDPAAKPAAEPATVPTPKTASVMDTHMYVVALTGVEAIIFSVVIFLAVTAHTSFRPTFEAGNALAVKSAVQILMTIWVLGLIHKYSQRWLNKMRPKYVDWRWRTFDISTSFAPAALFALAVLVMSISPTPFASWWKWFVALIAAIVIDALKEDIPTLRLLWQKKI
ncbi:MAG: hypothetical protein AAB790_02985 [Patescibacteria group bacterium]